MRCANDNQFDTPHTTSPLSRWCTLRTLFVKSWADDYFSGKHSIKLYWALNYFMAWKALSHRGEPTTDHKSVYAANWRRKWKAKRDKFRTSIELIKYLNIFTLCAALLNLSNFPLSRPMEAKTNFVLLEIEWTLAICLSRSLAARKMGVVARSHTVNAFHKVHVCWLLIISAHSTSTPPLDTRAWS